MRVALVDPSAYTPPYDHSLAAALVRAGLDVELLTSRPTHGAWPPADGYRRRELFYPWQPRGRARQPAKLLQHVPGMLRARRAAVDLFHFQWLPVQPVDARLLPRRPVVLTAHDVLPREPRPGQLRAQRALYERVDAVVVHSEHGRARLTTELGIDPAKVEVIPHGAFTHFTPTALPPELSKDSLTVLFAGLLRPYKGLDVLLEAWRGIDDAQLWVVGHPRMRPPPMPPGATLVPRFVSDGELAACMEAADLVVLPYREIDQSGVLYTALGLGRPLLLSAVGGFPEVAAQGAAELVPPGEATALRSAIERLLADASARARLAQGARAAAAGPYSWDAIAARHVDLYGKLTGR